MKYPIRVENIEWSTGRARENCPRETVIVIDSVNSRETHAWETEVKLRVHRYLCEIYREEPRSYDWHLSSDDPWEEGDLGQEEEHVVRMQVDPHRDANINAAVGLVPLRIMIDEHLSKSIENELENNDWSNEGQLVRVALREFLDNQNS